MKAVAVHIVDDVVTEDEFEGDRIRAKIHRDGRGYVICDGTMVLYRRLEKVVMKIENDPV
jgi:hypothetical protein